MNQPNEQRPEVSPEALRRAFAGPDPDPRSVDRHYLVIADGVPHDLREPREATDEPKTPTPSRLTPAEATAALDAINAGFDAEAWPPQNQPTDPETAHGQADLILLRAIPVEVADAYQRLVEQRTSWWAHA